MLLKKDATDGFKPFVRTHSSPALAYGVEISDSGQVPGGLLGKTAIPAQFGTQPTHDDSLHKEYKLTEMLQTTPAWLFAYIVVTRVGSGTMVTNNMGQMVESLNLPKHTTTPAALALFS
ncbi:MAG: hypothetical protein SGARI_000819, partial [Bacillariaceae sp.]